MNLNNSSLKSFIKATMPHLLLQLFKWVDLLLFSVSYHRKSFYFLLLVGQNKHFVIFCAHRTFLGTIL